MTRERGTDRPPGEKGKAGTSGQDLRGVSPRPPGTHRRSRRLVIGMLALAALAVLLSQAGRLPGPAGDAIRRNAAADRDATALFYTEVDGWPAWSDSAPNR